MYVSGDPVELLMPEVSDLDRAVFREAMGFNDPMHVQFMRWASKAVRGDLGESYYQKRPSLEIVLDRLPTTMLLTFLGLGFGILVAIPAGILSAIYRNSFLDHIVTFTVLLGQSMPLFWTGIMLMLLFAVKLQWLPVSGWDSPASMILPVVTLGTFQMPLMLRMVRSSMLEVLELDYIRTARAKGLNEGVTIFKHALKNAAIPIVTIVGLQLGPLLGGAVVTETVFAVPGMGRLLYRSIGQLDFPVVQASVLTLALMIVTVNLLIDIIYSYLNPQVRTG